MRISAKARYGCLALIDIAQSDADGFRRRVRDIANAQAIPARYLPQILIRLKAAGFVRSARGPDGGYQLALSPSSIALRDVIAAIDGLPKPTLPGNSVAARNLADILAHIQSAEQKMLGDVTIAQLAQQVGPESWAI
jgi:Rrf2 family protein